MLNNAFLILSDGILGEVAFEIAKDMGCYGEVALLDARYGSPDNDEQFNKKVIGSLSDYEEFAGRFSAAVAACEDPHARLEWTEKLEEAGYRILPVVSPKAFVGNTAQVEGGCIIEPMAFVGERVAVGPCCLIKAGAIIDHGSAIGYGCNLENKCYVQSGALVDNESTVSAGSVIESYENYLKARAYN